MKISTAVATVLGISTLVLAVQAGADWQYTDDKGKSHKVILKMDVPRQYSNTAVEVDGSAHGSNTVVPAGVPTLPVLVPEQQPTGPAVQVPGKMWWTYPEGSPEREAARQENLRKAAELRQKAAELNAASQRLQSATQNVQRYRVQDYGADCLQYADAQSARETRLYGSASREENLKTFSDCAKNPANFFGR